MMSYLEHICPKIVLAERVQQLHLVFTVRVAGKKEPTIVVSEVDKN